MRLTPRTIPLLATVVTDERHIVITAPPEGGRTLDFNITLKATEGDVLSGDTKEGTMAMRLCPSPSMNSSKSGVSPGPSTGHAFNSNGDRDSPDPKGNPVSVVIFSHPSNLRSPATWHARDYGLFAVNPFGVHDFEPDKPAGAGDYTIKKCDSLRLRYRFYFAKGQADAAKLDAAFAVFAKAK